MNLRRMAPVSTLAIGCLVLGGSFLCGVPALAEEGKRDLEGSVELLYRDVSIDGSPEKYDEDFDRLDSGLRLASLDLNWDATGSNFVDYARVSAYGLGGDPYERSSLRIGRKDVYKLQLSHRKQSYAYNLFELTPDEDGQFWNTERRQTDLDLFLYPWEKVQLFVQFQQGERSGDSLFMKDIQRDLFRLETPADQVVERYSVGANIEVGQVDILVRQMLRRYDNEFNNVTEGDLGLNVTDSTTLSSYDWLQNETGTAQLTTLKVHTPLGKRLDLSVSLTGTLLGEDEIRTNVDVNASGTDFNGAPFAIVDGFSDSDVEADTTLVDVDLAVRIADPVDLVLQYRQLDRDADGRVSSDLDGDGTPDDFDGDGTPGSVTLFDYDIETITGLFEIRPHSSVALRAGYRTIDRELVRDGFGGVRDGDFESDGDETLIFGVAWKPAKWLKLNADFEEGDVDQSFTRVSPLETEHTRFRATFTPQREMKIDLSYLDFENDNTATSFKSRAEGDSLAVSFWHKPNERVNYLFRYAEQEYESATAILFDTAGFFGTEDGDSLYDIDSSQWLGQVNFAWGKSWNGFVRYWMTESDGNNLFVGDVSGIINDAVIDQDYEDVEVGVIYTFASGLYLGTSIRDFDYDDGGVRIDSNGNVVFRNDGLDYDGQIFTLRAGLTF